MQTTLSIFTKLLLSAVVLATLSACVSHHRHHRHNATVVKAVKVKTPAVGVHVAVLPRGNKKIVVGGKKYRYYGGVFYSPTKFGYTVVKAPIGYRVTALPSGHTTVVVSGKKYFVHKGTYYVYRKKHKKYEVVIKPV